jgi:hypothetical protein
MRRQSWPARVGVPGQVNDMIGEVAPTIISAARSGLLALRRRYINDIEHLFMEYARSHLERH